MFMRAAVAVNETQLVFSLFGLYERSFLCLNAEFMSEDLASYLFMKRAWLR